MSLGAGLSWRQAVPFSGHAPARAWRRLIRLSGLPGLLLAVLAAPPALAQTGAHCAPDLIKAHGLKLPQAVLLRSRSQEDLTQPSQLLCETTYVVPGHQARAVEALLRRRYGMGKLVFECCGWAPEKGRSGYFRRSHPMADGAEAVYAIILSSEETLERRWDRIGNFYLTLSIYAL